MATRFIYRDGKAIPEQGVQLLGVGWCKGTPVEEVQPGQRLVYNFGLTGEVLSVAPKSAKTLLLTTKSDTYGTTHTKVKRIGTLVVVIDRSRRE